MEIDPEVIKANLETMDKALGKEPAPQAPRQNVEGGVRTYATDIAEMMRREKGSIIKIALAEQKRRDESMRRKDPTSTKNVIVIMLGLVLIVGGIMIFVYSIISRSRPVPVTNVSPTLPSFIFTENQVQIDMTDMNRTELIDAINTQLANATLVPGTINNLYVSYRTSAGQTMVPATVFFQKLGVNIPDTLFQNLYPGLMLGVYNQTAGNDLFLILRVKDFNDAFLAMREWESSMLAELVRLFDIDTSAYGKTIFSKDFVTETLFNKEARLVKDDAGKVLLSYIFLDPKTIMITTKIDSVEEVTKRLNLQTLK